MTAAEITNLLFLQDPPGHSDLAIVFGHREPTMAACRARHAASLFLEGRTPRLLFTGGATTQGSRSEAEEMAEVARHCGVPENAMLLEVQSRTTAANLAFSVALLSEKKLLAGTKTIHLCSCPWHMKRLSYFAQSAFGPNVRLLYSPHDECCTATNWTASAKCREYVLAELHLVRQ
jgi:uncharacterized SAM-binding protein YcdF (DUF218 family)